MKNRNYDAPVIDGHCHLASTHFLPRAFYEGLVDNVAAKLEATGIPANKKKLLGMYLSQSQDHEGDELVVEMDKAGIDKAVVLLPDFTYVMKSDFTIEEMFLEHSFVLEKHVGRFAVFAGVDPRWGEDGVSLFRKGVEQYGFKGLKIYPPCGYSPSDKILFPYYEVCAEHNLPVLLHIGPTSPALSFEMSHPQLIDGAATNFPTVNFILAHGGVVHVDECAALCAFRPNIYLDTGAFLGSLHPGGWQQSFEELFRRNISHKVIFGTDWPVFRMSGGQRKVLTQLCDENGPLSKLSATHAEWIMHKNISRLVDFD